MNTFERKSLAVGRRQAKALERIADALERAQQPEMEPVEEIDLSGIVTWQDAIHIMRSTCIEADECGPGCPMNTWCQSFNKEGSAPAKWEPMENGEEVKE